ncbi:MAG: FHA domain-containing protein [Porticoccaceae bacterium]|nr:FHA domain-containing protein [Porticoccaceae bacterium]
MKSRSIAALSLLIFSLVPSLAAGYSDFSNKEASKSVVLVKATGILGSARDIDAVAVAPNLLLVTAKSVSGLSVKLSIEGKDATVVNSLASEHLALISFPTGGLTPVLLSKATGKSKRNVHVVRHAGDTVSGTLLNFSTGRIDMSMSKTLLSSTGSGVFNNCGELIGIYDQDAPEKVASAISISLINKVLDGVDGTLYSKTVCPSEIEKRALDEELRAIEREKVKAETIKKEAEAQAKQQAAEEALRISREKVAEQEEASKKALAEAETKSKEELDKKQAALDLAKKDAAEKEALAKEAKITEEAEKLAAEEALRKSNKANAEVAMKLEEQQKLMLMGAIALGLLLVIGIVILFRRSKRQGELELDETTEPEVTALLSFDVLIRGDAVGIKVPAELIARTRGVVIGRSAADSDFVIDSPELSRSHARLSEKDGILYLEDLGSANGTILNGLKLKPAQLVALHDGDELELAISMFAVEFQQR